MSTATPTTEHRTKVVTYESSRAERLRICSPCAERLAGDWPTDRTGEELARVHKGMHWGVCDVHGDHDPTGPLHRPTHPHHDRSHTMNNATRTTLSDNAREILAELGISVISDDASGRFPAPGGYVALGDEGAGPYEGLFLITAVEEACEAVADPSRFTGDEDRTADAYRFEAFHDALDAAISR